ncbi:MAG: hypothetical protein AAFX00_14580, partial [Pseudomonadota bacterium]
DGRPISVARAAAMGARLIETIRIPELRRLVRDVPWDAVVLQDFSATPLNIGMRLASRTAIRRLIDLARPAPVVLYPHWPSAPGHRVYGAGPAPLGSVVPDNLQDYARRAEAHYAALADAHGARLAPVLRHWVRAVDQGQSLYAADRHHANDAGAALAAEAVWGTLADTIPA